MIPNMNMVLNRCWDSYEYTEDNGRNFRPDWTQGGTKHGRQEIKVTNHSWEVARFLSQAPEKRILKFACLLPRVALL